MAMKKILLIISFVILSGCMKQHCVSHSIWDVKCEKKVDWNKFLCLNFSFNLFPAPEKPDFESIVISFGFIRFFFISGIKGN